MADLANQHIVQSLTQAAALLLFSLGLSIFYDLNRPISILSLLFQQHIGHKQSQIIAVAPQIVQ